MHRLDVLIYRNYFSHRFRESDSLKDDHLCARIQVEFDTFVLRASNYIYLSRFLGAWQYLAILPFSELHITTTWKLYYMLTSGFSKDLIENVTDGTITPIVNSISKFIFI